MPSTVISIYADDDFERLNELRQAVNVARIALAAQRQQPILFADDDPAEAVAEAQEAFNAFVGEAAERAEAWRIESLGRRQFKKLLADHPPRTEPDPDDPTKTVVHPEDRQFGVDTTTFPDALLTYVDPDDSEHRTLLEAGDVDLSHAPALERRLDRLSLGQFEHLWITAWTLNTGGIADPKAERFVTATSSSDET